MKTQTMNDTVSPRAAEVLGMIVRHYVETAEPVSSRIVARKLALSSATIRNVMADLEDLGYITHPYTSAGRIPTDKGYRLFIDSLMRVRKVNDQLMHSIDSEYHHAVRSLEDVLERTSHMISSFTNYVGISFLPQFEKVYFDGASHFLEQPEFKDLRKLHSLLKWLEHKHEVIDSLSCDLENCALTVRIGRENSAANLKECTVITRGYKVKGKSAGKVGVIGPKRMVYEKVIPTIEYLADRVERLIDGIGTE